MGTTFLPQRTLRNLGWDSILTALAERTVSQHGRELALALPFLHDRPSIERNLTLVDEVRTLLRKELSLPLGDAVDVRAAVARAAKGAVLEPAELQACARLIRAAARVRRFLWEHRAEVPLIASLGADLPEATSLAARFETAFEPSGRLRDEASGVLASLRDKSRGLHHRIKEELEELLEDHDVAMSLRESYVSIRNDRYVVPINASFRSQVPGIVHNASNSGQTLFVEPEQIVGLGNELSIAQSMVEEEERRILVEFSADVGERADELAFAVERLGELDRLQASAFLADDLDAVRPELQEGRAPFALLQARHPLLVLQGKKVVPNDIRLEGSQRALVLSGPNAGGKTVSLTTVGLCSLLTRAGLPIPAKVGSSVPLYGGIYAAIGDDQDLAKDLSTFSAHLTSLKHILEAAREGSLVLIDEIAADTDPREGAAIAKAVLDALVAKGVQVVVTTHLEEIKALGLVDELYANARVGLDPQTLSPTFRLEMGAAGVSSALEIARRIGLPEAVLEGAQQALHGGSALSAALESLERERLEVERQGRELATLQQEAASLRASLAAKEKELAVASAEVEARVRGELAEELAAVRAEVGEWVAKLSRQPSVRAAVETQKRVQERMERAEADKRKAEARAEVTRQAKPAPTRIRVGTRVKVPSLGATGDVLELSGDEAVVQAGILKVRVPVADLVAVAAPAPKQQAQPKRARRQERAAAPDVLGPEHRCDVRGLRADDALRQLESFLDRAYSEGAAVVHVVHGHGTGALRAAVREALATSPYVTDFGSAPQEQGGDGVTVVELRQ